MTTQAVRHKTLPRQSLGMNGIPLSHLAYTYAARFASNSAASPGVGVLATKAKSSSLPTV